jgi:hypothetical protein
MVQFTSYVTGVQKAVDTININKNTSERKSELILKELRKKAEKAKEDLTRLESPPPAIKIKSL